jgi:putative hydrolase of the HAD superfamily
VLAPYGVADLDHRLLATERKNLRLFGYGVKGFTLSVIETAIELSGGQLSASDVQSLIDLGKGMLQEPVELLPGVREVVERLARSNLRLLLLTKGDLFDQEARIARSGLVDFFSEVEVLSEKDEGSYRRALARSRVRPEEFLMVGNSVRSDVLPVLGLGGAAAHVPYPLLWAHETADAPTDHPRFYQLQSLADLPRLLGR